MIACPKCGSKSIGRIGQNQYYCWDCSIEFAETDRGIRMFKVEPDGTLSPDDQDSMTMESAENKVESQKGGNPEC